MTEEEQNLAARKTSTGAWDAGRQFLDGLTPADRRDIENLIRAFPSETNMMRLLIKLATNQYRTAFGKKERVAIVGPTNVGKSTLYNQLVRRKEDRAKVSPIPGTTSENQAADTGLFIIFDTPGSDAVGPGGETEQTLALEAASSADFLIIVYDAIQGIKREELNLFDRLVGLGKPYMVVLNKIDLVRHDERKILEGAATALHLQPDQIIPIVARTGENLEDVLAVIAVTEPEIVAALGQAMPLYRWQLAWRTIISAASASAAIALTPLPVIDFIPLSVTQSLMVLSIARIYNYKITLQRARELLFTFGVGFLGRTLFQEISKLGGIPGWLLSAAIATSTTAVMGIAASVWFDTGERLSSETLQRINREISTYLVDSLRTLGARRPGRKTLREDISKALEKAPIDKEREKLNQSSNNTVKDNKDKLG